MTDAEVNVTSGYALLMVIWMCGLFAACVGAYLVMLWILLPIYALHRDLERLENKKGTGP